MAKTKPVREAVKRKPAKPEPPLSLKRACWLLENLKRELAVAHLEAEARIDYLINRLEGR